ncbi:MBL fold metallo-hydrolase [Streptomyces sp. bgisy153]|uniref:MBL fold metallo-hydrolase n=1 Tax=Streptomyces sp. bgisy153 TaxID=3413793 RepID=UPI003D76196B
MRVSRRNVLRGSTAALGAVALPAWAVPRRSGALQVLPLLDAAGPFPLPAHQAFPGVDDGDWARAERVDPGAFGPDDVWRPAFRCFAVRRPGGRVTLVDTGVGPAGSPASGWAPTPGELPARLARAGIGVTDVEAVVLTHLHSDHYGWSVLPDGAPVFPAARYLVQRVEVSGLPADDPARSYVVEPLRGAGLLAEVDGRCRVRGRGGALTLVPTPGHTPGHQSVLVEGGREEVWITGDVLVHAVQLVAPGTAYRYEADPGQARRSRLALLASARRRRASLATCHLHRPFVTVG